jgi:ketosteroid isomerase-like protein
MTRSEDASQVRALVENWAQGVRDKDMDRVLAHHADDLVVFDVPMPLQSQGMVEYKKTWELFFDHSPGGPGSFDLAELQIFASETIAYCHGIVHVIDAKVRLTMGMRKQGGQWWIAHEHHSYPIELK